MLYKVVVHAVDLFGNIHPEAYNVKTFATDAGTLVLVDREGLIFKVFAPGSWRTIEKLPDLDGAAS